MGLKYLAQHFIQVSCVHRFDGSPRPVGRLEMILVGRGPWAQWRDLASHTPTQRPCGPHLCSHLGYEPSRNGPAEHIPPQARVPGVLEVADAAAHAVPVLHVCALELLVDM